MPFLLGQLPDSPPAPAGPVQDTGGGGTGMLFVIAAVFLIWWLLVIRPQGKERKAREAKLAAVKRGDTVRTRGGIEGVVARVQDDKVIVRIDTDGKVQVAFAKAYIDDVIDESSSDEPKAS